MSARTARVLAALTSVFVVADIALTAAYASLFFRYSSVTDTGTSYTGRRQP